MQTACAEDAAIPQGSPWSLLPGVERKQQERVPPEAGMSQTWLLGVVREEELWERSYRETDRKVRRQR